MLLDLVDPPLGFGGIQAADLSGWSPKRRSPVFDSFLADLGAVLGAPTSPKASTPDVAPISTLPLAAKEDPANQSNAAETPFTSCDRMAVEPNDSQKRAPGAARAVPSCKAALVRWLSGLSGRRFIIGGLAAVALLGTGVFQAWQNLWSHSVDGDIPVLDSTNNTTPQIGAKTAFGSRNGSSDHIQSAGEIAIGEHVVAQWWDGCFYSASVLNVRDNDYLIYYGFAEERWTDSSRVFVLNAKSIAELLPGTGTLVKLPDYDEKWLRSHVVRGEASRFLVSIEDEGCHRGTDSVWVARDQLVAIP